MDVDRLLTGKGQPEIPQFHGAEALLSQHDASWYETDCQLVEEDKLIEGLRQAVDDETMTEEQARDCLQEYIRTRNSRERKTP